MKKKGNVAILTVIIFAVLLSFAAYVIDVGLLYAERIKLENAIDSAALAAALELPTKPQTATDIANQYLDKNGVNSQDANINIAPNNKSIEITAQKEVSNIFAKIFGIDKSTVKAKSKAVLGPAKSVRGGLRPFGVVAYDFSYGDLVTLKEEAGDGYHGNYNVLAIGGQGSNVFYINAMYGYDGVINVGDLLDTEPGNMAGVVNDLKNYINSEVSTFETFQRDSIRLWTIPLVNTMEVDGRKKVLVVGFAQFYVENIDKKSGKAEITGRFIKYVTNAEIDMSLNDTGVYGVKLSR